MTTTPEYLAEAINILCERGEIITRIDITVSSGEWGEPKEQYNIQHTPKSQLLTNMNLASLHKRTMKKAYQAGAKGKYALSELLAKTVGWVNDKEVTTLHDKLIAQLNVHKQLEALQKEKQEQEVEKILNIKPTKKLPKKAPKRKVKKTV